MRWMRLGLSTRGTRLLVLVATGLVSACAAAPPPRSPSTGADELGLSAVAGYGRHAAVRAKADIRMVNAGPGAVEVMTVQLRHPLFDVIPSTARAASLQPDRKSRIVPVPFGGVRCEATDPEGAEVVLGVRTEEGVVDVAVPLTDGEPGLVRAHRLACAAAAVADTAAIELGPDWDREQTADRVRLRTTLRVERREQSSIAVTQLLGNILFDVSAPTTEPVLLLAAGENAAEVEVVVTAKRCDPHALTESKTSFTFPVFAQVDGGEQVATTVTASGSGREALEALLQETCGIGR